MDSFICMAPMKGSERWRLGATLTRNSTLEFLKVTQVMSLEEWQEDVLDLCGCPGPCHAAAHNLFYIKVYHDWMH